MFCARISLVFSKAAVAFKASLMNERFHFNRLGSVYFVLITVIAGVTHNLFPL